MLPLDLSEERTDVADGGVRRTGARFAERPKTKQNRMEQAFEAVIETSEKFPGGCYVVIPFDVTAVYGASRVRVQATFDGVPYRGTAMKYSGHFMLVLRKAIRAQLGKEPGDKVLVRMWEDVEPRTVEVPSPLREALAADAALQAAFERMSFTHRKEWAESIAAAKRADTKERRTQKCLVYLRDRYEL